MYGFNMVLRQLSNLNLNHGIQNHSKATIYTFPMVIRASTKFFSVTDSHRPFPQQFDQISVLKQTLETKRKVQTNIKGFKMQNFTPVKFQWTRIRNPCV